MSYAPSITEYICGLCTDDATRFLSLEFSTFCAHVVETHGWDEAAVKAIKGRTEMFLDGRRGSAQQIARFRDEAGTLVLERVWSSGDFMPGEDTPARKGKKDAMSEQPLTPRGSQIAPATKLARMLRNTIDAARHSGTDQRLHLSGGAEVVARVRDGVALVTIKRQDVEVGAVELKTFLRDANVPADAERRPAEGQNERDGWHYITYRWTDERTIRHEQ